MNKQFIDGVLEVLRDDDRQICKQTAHIIAELAEEIDGLQSLNNFQQQQISCMESDINKMKCCQNCDNSRYTEQGTTCKDDDLECDDLSHWVLRR